MTNNTTLPNITALLNLSFKNYKARFKEFTPLILAYIAVGASGAFIQHLIPNNPPLTFGVEFITIALQTYLIGNLILVIAHKNPNLARSKIIPLIVLMFLTSFTLLFGVILFIIPGALIATYLCLSMYILLPDHTSVKASLYASRNYVRDYGWQVFYRLLIIFLPYAILTILTTQLKLPYSISTTINILFASLYWPFTTLFTFQLYNNLKEIKGPINDTASTKFKLFLWGLLTFSIISLALIFLASLTAFHA